MVVFILSMTCVSLLLVIALFHYYELVVVIVAMDGGQP